MALGDSAYDAFNQQMSQYFGPLKPSQSGIVNVPGVGGLQRLYKPAPTQDQFVVRGGEMGSGGEADPAAYQAALAAYNATPEAQRYMYTTAASIDPNALTGHGQRYDYDPNTQGVKADGWDFDNTPSLWGDKIFPGIVMAALSAAGGMAGAGVLGAAGGGAGAAGGAGELGSLSAADALGEFGGQAALGGTQAGTDLASLGGSLGSYAGDGAALAYPAAETSGGLLNVGADVAGNAATQPGAWDTALNAAKDGWTSASNAWGSVNPLLRTGLTSLAGEAFQGGGGNDVAGLAALDSAAVASEGMAPGLFDSYGSVSTPWYQSVLNQLGGKAGSNPISSIANILGGNGTGADYSSLLGAGASLLGAGASIYGGIAGSNAAKTAANQQTDAINNASALTSKLYGDSVTRNQPFLNAGTSALTQQTNLLGLNGGDAQKSAFGQFQASPDYQWRFDQGTKAVGNNAAATGMLGSGRYMKDLTNYGQGQASTEYGNYQSRLSNLVNVGQNSANLTGQLSQGYGQLASNLLGAGGIAQSAGTIGSANAVTNALSQLLKLNQNGYYGT